ncbi:hypothetical protein ACIQNU_27300 [Streptomyces sp. NPDC091292]|uniref:hypothetical protein n=1 Tax=Streptomyces sp. NPDC091292 TaxID=3365991 RepID=UPI0037FC6499
MRWCLVTVERCPVDPAPEWSLPPGSALSMSVHLPSGRYGLLARTGGGTGRMGWILDEHVAVDADQARDDDVRAACADVLYGSRPRPAGQAVRWLTAVAAAHPGCRLVAAPLAGGGWTALSGPDGTAVMLPCAVPAGSSLFASCLHGWLVAGRELTELSAARITCRAAGDARNDDGRIRAPGPRVPLRPRPR